MQKFFIYSLLLIGVSSVFAYKIDNYISKIDSNKLEINTSFNLDKDEVLYQDSFGVTSSNPGITVNEPKTDSSVINFFDPVFKQNKNGYKNLVEYKYIITKNNDFNSAIEPVINYNYYVNSESGVKSGQIDLSESLNIKKNLEQKADYNFNHKEAKETGFIQKILKYLNDIVLKAKRILSDLFSSTGSWSIRLLIALLLGILLSLTPCLYPMIPITVGILQANKVKNGFQSFLMALSYTIGVSLTFAVLGLVAAASSSIFGELQGSPYFVIPLVLLLGYLGLSMFGFYEMYIPRFLQSNSEVKGGSYLSAFAFGAVSGTVASPCLSPGLALILNYVTSISHSGSIYNYLEGFLLLFTFGIGSSLPLLIIGTFSSAVNVLPKAGQWMVEVKKLVGLMLICMCFYNLSSLTAYIPMWILLLALALVLLFFGIYYFWSIKSYDSTGLKVYKNIVGLLLVCASIFSAYSGIKSMYQKPEHDTFWLDYDNALDSAKNQSKRLFIDIGATYCGACKELDKEIFQKSNVREKIAAGYVPVKVESDVDTDSFESLKQKYGKYISGFPTYLIVDQNSGEVINKWGSELEDISISEFLNSLDKFKS